MTMKLCYNEACTMGFLDPENDIKYAASAGFDMIELRLDCLRAYQERGKSLKDLKKLIDDQELLLGPLNALYLSGEQMYYEDKDSISAQRFLSDLDFITKLSEQFGYRLKVILVAPFLANGAEANKIAGSEVLTKTLNVMQDTIRQYDFLDFYLEPVGLAKSTIRNASLANKIIKELNAPNGQTALVLDACNLFLEKQQSDFYFADIDKNDIGIIHLMNGINPKQQGEISDQKWRRFCGDGDWVDTRAFLTAIKKTGYNDVFSVEEFHHGYETALGHEGTIKKAFQSLSKEMSTYFNIFSTT